MPKAFLKKKNQKRFTTFISNNSKLNSERNIIKNNSNNILTDIKPSFPPNLTPNDLIKNTSKSSNSSNNNNKPKVMPNAFIAYRMALIKEYRIKSRKLPPMGELSKVAKNSWNIEPKHVKDFYVSLVMDAKSIYRQNNLQIVLDKRMNDSINYVENEQTLHQCRQHAAVDSHVTHEDTICTENFPIQDSVVNDSNDVSFPSISSTNTYSPELNSDFQEEYIKMLEQVISYLLGN